MPRLEIGFSVQVLRLYERDVFGLGCCTDNDVAGERLVSAYLDKVSYAHILPCSCSPMSVRGVDINRFLLELGLLREGFVRLDVRFSPLAVRYTDSTGKGLALLVHPIGVLPPSTLQNEHFGVVHSPIGLVSLNILIPVLESSYEEYDQEGDDDETGGNGGELGEELEDDDECEEPKKEKLNVEPYKLRGAHTYLLFDGIVRGDCVVKK